MSDSKSKSLPKDTKEIKSQQGKGKGKLQAVKTDKIPQLQFEFLDQDKVDQAAHLYTKSFIAINPIWKKMGATYSQVFGVNRGRMISCARAGWICSMCDANTSQIIGLAILVDLFDYMGFKTMPTNSEFLKILGKYGHQLEDQYFFDLLKTAKRGQYVYNYGGVVHIRFANSGISKKFWAQGMAYLKLAGWKTYLTRVTNRITTKLLSGFGGKVIKTLYMKQPGLQGQFLQLLRLDLTQLNFDTLTKFLDQKDANIDEFP